MRFASRPIRRAVMGLGLSVVLGGCTSPQSGIFATELWCKVDPADGPNAQLLDDLEDGDGKACNKQGTWSVIKGKGGGSTTPEPGPIKTSNDLSDSDLMVRTGQRALFLQASGFQDGEWAALHLDLSDGDLSSVEEVQFWARSATVGSLELRAAVATDTTAASGVHWGGPVTITENWGDGQGKPFSFPLIGDGDGLAPDDQKDLAHSQALEFQVRATAEMSAFGFWIDDVVLKRRP